MSKPRKAVEDGAFISIQGWMTRLVKPDGRVLSLPELAIFANIWGFSQDGKSQYRGGTGYLAEFLHMSKPTVIAHLKALTEAGLINRIEEEVNGVTFVNYSVDNQEGLNFLTGGKESLPGVKNLNGGGKEILPGGGKESLPINKSIENKEGTKSIVASADAAANTPACDSSPSPINTEKEAKAPTTPKAPAAPARRAAKPAGFDFRGELIALGVNPQTADDWMAVRKAKKAANTQTAFNILKAQIEKAGAPAEECIALAVEKSWQGFRADWFQNDRERTAAPAFTPVPQYTMYGRPVRPVEARREPRAID